MDDNISRTSGLEYHHQSLPDASNYIRLLTATSRDGHEPHKLDCELTKWRIDDSPAFYAISYSWGDAAQTAVLRVNGRSMSVTQNCELALCQANYSTSGLSQGQKSHKRDKCYFWCDAVCIDQRNQAEKEAQVAAMGGIYRRAEHVLACLGAPTEGTNSPFLFRKLRSRSGQLRRIGEHWLPQGEFHVDVARMTDGKWTRMVNWFLLSMPRRSVIRLCEALESLLGTEYFQRTWICQELFLGKSVHVCCGLDCVPVSSIFGLAQVSTYLSSAWVIQPVDRVWRLFNPYTPPQQLRHYNCGWTGYFLWLLSAGSSPNPQTRSLGSLTWKIRYQECGDIRDKVYGTLAMVRWPDDEAISVDYCRDIFDLAMQVMAVVKKRPGAWDGRWYDLAANVAGNLRLGAQCSEHLVQEIRKRSSDMASQLGILGGPIAPRELSFTRGAQQHDVHWVYRLVKTASRWAFEGLSAPLSGLAESRTTRLWSWDVGPRPPFTVAMAEDPKLDEVILPPTALPGDWCLLHSEGRPIFQLESRLTALNRHLRINRVILIAREVRRDPHHPLSLIGKGLINSEMTFMAIEPPVAAEFKVSLADDDALVLAATSGVIEGYGHDRRVRSSRISVPASKDETPCYFSTAVCSSLYSSYALRVEQRCED